MLLGGLLGYGHRLLLGLLRLQMLGIHGLLGMLLIGSVGAHEAHVRLRGPSGLGGGLLGHLGVILGTAPLHVLAHSGLRGHHIDLLLGLGLLGLLRGEGHGLGLVLVRHALR